ncbi:hypothetical protein FA15DRAFT_753531 [Coprinopsis marcescibilis]|uniref:Uncharacterized protein n=1 Tax=Coprinopsis marcescibilis TaxID=230819 RepID=A0A5C3L5W9_COPMA|nr:hypothetical protein FA15DRAFT_753531 [Coprinopsis marcescibilis]
MSTPSEPKIWKVRKEDLELTPDDTLILLLSDVYDTHLINRFINAYDGVRKGKDIALPLDNFIYVPQYFVVKKPDSNPDSRERLVFVVSHLSDVATEIATRVTGLSGVVVFVDKTFGVPMRAYSDLIDERLKRMAAEFIIVKVGVPEWSEPTRQGFNRAFGDLIREGAECMDVDDISIRQRQIVNYALNRSSSHVQEEMIGWVPIVSTKASKLYKQNLDILAPASWR